MMILLELVLYCLLFFLLVKGAARNSGPNCLYFYSKEYLDEAQKRGIADKESTMKKGKRFMIPFCIVMFVVLVLILSVWNHVTDFKIDYLWVGHSKIWAIEGMEGVPYLKSWKTIFVRRTAGTVLYLLIALVVAGIVVLIG